MITTTTIIIIITIIRIEIVLVSLASCFTMLQLVVLNVVVASLYADAIAKAHKQNAWDYDKDTRQDSCEIAFVYHLSVSNFV